VENTIILFRNTRLVMSVRLMECMFEVRTLFALSRTDCLACNFTISDPLRHFLSGRPMKERERADEEEGGRRRR
jgi:hypothetical protein